MRFMPLFTLAIPEVFEYTPQQKYPVCKSTIYKNSFSIYKFCSHFFHFSRFVFLSTNLKQLLHFAQMSKVKRFQQYDYGL